MIGAESFAWAGAFALLIAATTSAGCGCGEDDDVATLDHPTGDAHDDDGDDDDDDFASDDDADDDADGDADDDASDDDDDDDNTPDDDADDDSDDDDADDDATSECPEGMSFVPGGKTVVLNHGTRWGGPDVTIEETAVVDDFCIDIYEASQPDATESSWGSWHWSQETDPPPATSRTGVWSWVDISQEDAQHACEAAGKRLPTIAEWQTAYSGHEGVIWPWGSDEFDETNTCLVGMPWAAYPGGACCYENCLHDVCWEACDMVGNISEWTATDWNPECPANANVKTVAGGYTNGFESNTDQYEDPPGSECWYYSGWSHERYGMHAHDASTIRFHDDGFRCAKSLELKR
ncbi:SUMF1/EgtB/PvdO family nonheme iron enzyme [bacterium]|nr:SUMF1/EgtB/PvdO family nonheme iron enzyme [bacterium]